MILAISIVLGVVLMRKHGLLEMGVTGLVIWIILKGLIALVG